jgi:hypothetical protein
MISRTMRLHDPRMINDIVDLCRIVPPNSIGIEIGCFTGESSELFAKSGKFSKLICVDPWQQGYYKKHDMRQVEMSFDERTARYKCIVKSKTDSTILGSISKDNQVNFIYIDGNHQYEQVHRDIANSLRVLSDSKSPLTKILAGHDYKFPKSPGVEKAVHELLGYPDIMFAGYSWAKIIR